MDERLLVLLKNKSELQHSLEISQTRQVIENELNTSIVVIFRLLKKLERLGKIELYRNRIKIIHLLHLLRVGNNGNLSFV